MTGEAEHGYVQHEVQEAVDRLVESGAERGVQVAAYRDGELIVDAVAGDKIEPGTVFYNYSIGKGATATVAHIGVERGWFGYDTPVAELWPEFAAHGKHSVTVRHVLTHSAGVPALPPDTTVDTICDWDAVCAAIADAELWWEPGTQVGYHSYTFGYLVGEVVRRATGKRISEVLRDEVTGPLGVADELYFGMPRAEHHRLAVLEDEGELPTLPDDHPLLRAGPAALFPTAALGNRTDVLEADIPAGAKTSARAIARMYAALLGPVDGVRLVGPDTLRAATTVAASGKDQVFGNHSTWGLGYALGGLGKEAGHTDSTFGIAGAGGSYACGDPASGIAFALTKNRLSMDFTAVNTVSKIIFGALT